MVLSLAWLWGLGSLLAVIFAVRARRQIRASTGKQSGDGLAIAGLVIGIVGLLGAALTAASVFGGTIAVNTTTTHAQDAWCQTDATSVVTALEAYNAQNMSYPTVPATWSAESYSSNYGPLTKAGPHGGPY